MIPYKWLYEISRTGKSMETARRPVLPGVGRKVEWGVTAYWVQVSFWGDENDLELIISGDCTTLWMS